MGKSHIEEKVMMEINAAAEVLEATKGQPTVISTVLHKVIGNVLHRIVFGSRLDFNDPDFQVVLNMSSFALNVFGAIKSWILLSCLGYLDVFKTRGTEGNIEIAEFAQNKGIYNEAG